MFQVGEYKIVFKKIWHDMRRIKGDGRYDTVCEIYIKDDTQEVPRWTGVAKLHPNDQVDRVIGKKVALRNALQKAFPPIAEGTILTVNDFQKAEFELMKFDAKRKFHRTEIWGAFWEWVVSWHGIWGWKTYLNSYNPKIPLEEIKEKLRIANKITEWQPPIKLT